MAVLPVPFIDHIPTLMKENISITGTAMVNKIDSNLLTWFNEILLTGHYYNADLVPSKFLDEIGTLLNAGILNGDSDAQKRKKLINAIPSHKRRTLFSTVKVLVDSITGTSSSLYNLGSMTEDDIMLSGRPDDPTGSYWGTIGYTGLDTNLGAWVVGNFTEPVIQGNIYIDTGNNALTPDQQNQLKVNLLNYAPAYMRLFIGYTTGSIFTTYFIIG